MGSGRSNTTRRGWLLALAVLCACGAEGEGVREQTGSGALVVYTVSEPLRSFAERIGGPAVEVHFPAPPEVVDPAGWQPDPETIAAYGSADLVLLNGGGYARWVARASLRRQRLVDTSASFRDRAIALADEVTHAHGPDGEHSHGGVATTFWLDLELARAQARAVAEAFARARPADAPAFRERAAALDAELEGLDEALRSAAEPLREMRLRFSHPVYAYLERRYGLSGDSFHWEPDEPPPEADWERLAADESTLMLWEADPRPETASRLAGHGIAVVVFEPAGGRSPDGDFVERMRANVERLAAASAPYKAAAPYK